MKSSTKRCVVTAIVVVFLLQATVDAGRLFQFQGDDANNGGAIIRLPSGNKGCEDGYKAVCVPAGRQRGVHFTVAEKNYDCPGKLCFDLYFGCIPCF